MLERSYTLLHGSSTLNASNPGPGEGEEREEKRLIQGGRIENRTDIHVWIHVIRIERKGEGKTDHCKCHML